MKRFLVLCMVSFGLLVNLGAGNPPKYVGVKKCKMCHNKAKTGAQYKVWLNSKHAKAYETLATAKAKEYGKARGVSDPQKSEKCLKCHVTAFGVDKSQLAKTFKMEDGVQCESCHGPGGNYYKMKTMKDLWAGKIEPASVGLVMPDEKVCVKCHNPESPAYKKFDFKTFNAQISHKIPTK